MMSENAAGITTELRMQWAKALGGSTPPSRTSSTFHHSPLILNTRSGTLGELVVRENDRLCGSPQDGYLVLDRAKFRALFAADVDQETAAFMADSQVPWGLS